MKVLFALFLALVAPATPASAASLRLGDEGRDERALRAPQSQDQRQDARDLQEYTVTFEGICVDDRGHYYDRMGFRVRSDADHSVCLNICPPDNSFVGYNLLEGDWSWCLCHYSYGHVSRSICAAEGSDSCRVMPISGEGPPGGGNGREGTVCKHEGTPIPWQTRVDQFEARVAELEAQVNELEAAPNRDCPICACNAHLCNSFQSQLDTMGAQLNSCGLLPGEGFCE